VTRVLSALILIPLVVGTVWFLPPIATLVLTLVAAVLAVFEYASLAASLGARVPRVLALAAVVAATIATCLSGAQPTDVDFRPDPGLLDVVILTALIAMSAAVIGSVPPGPAVLPSVGASLFSIVYLGVPLGALAALRMAPDGPQKLLLLMAVIVISDSAQYYTGRSLGRRPLAPAISPKKTREGAVGGLVFGTASFVVGARWVFPATPMLLLALVGATIAAAGMIGDLFESLLKRSAGVKDSSHLIPGHGGVLDRLDSWLFAAPVYYVFVRWVAQ
jgi:phosphatidate cytidylyltransferase